MKSFFGGTDFWFSACNFVMTSLGAQFFIFSGPLMTKRLSVGLYVRALLKNVPPPESLSKYRDY